MENETDTDENEESEQITNSFIEAVEKREAEANDTESLNYALQTSTEAQQEQENETIGINEGIIKAIEKREKQNFSEWLKNAIPERYEKERKLSLSLID